MIKKIILGIMGVVLVGATIFSPVSANAKFKELEMGKIGRKVFGIRKNVDDIGCIFDYIPPMGMEQSMAFEESYRRNLNCAGMFTEQEFKSIQKKYENPKKIYKEIMKEFKTTDVPFQAREINVLMMKYGSLSKKSKTRLGCCICRYRYNR